MAINYRKRIKVAPGVYMNISKSVISTTIGVRGASVNFGKNGTFVNTGIPGTGFYSRDKIGGGLFTEPAQHHSGGSYKGMGIFFLILAAALAVGAVLLDVVVLWAFAAFALLIAVACFKNVVSAKTDESLEHDYLSEAKSLVEYETDALKKRILQNFISFYELCDQIDDEERIIEKLGNKRETDKTLRFIEEHSSKIKELQDALQQTQYDVDAELTPWERRKYEKVCSAFETLITTQRIWRIVGMSLNEGNKLSSIISLTREECHFQVGVFDYLKSSFDIPSIQCGDKWLYLYPKFAILAKTATDFVVVSYDHIQFRGETTVFPERLLSDIPAESKRLGNTWEHINKDGQPDRRFADNAMLYNVEYGYLQIAVGKDAFDFHISNTSKLSCFLYTIYFYSFNSYWKPDNASTEELAMYLNSYKPTQKVKEEYKSLLSTHFQKINENMERLHFVVDKMNSSKAVVQEIEKHCKINNDQNFSFNFGEYSTALMLLVIRDVVYVYEGLCETYDFDDWKGMGLAVFFHRFFNRTNIGNLSDIDSFMNNGKDFADEYYNWYKSMFSMEYEPYKLVMADILSVNGCEGELVSEYKNSLYQAFYTIAKAGKYRPDANDMEWLNRIFKSENAMTDKQEQAQCDIGEATLNDIERVIPILLQETSVGVSTIQRYLSIGYARAGKIAEALERMGIISVADKNGLRRTVLIKDEKNIHERIASWKNRGDDKNDMVKSVHKEENTNPSSTPLDELNKLIGLQRVKEEISNIYNLIKLQNIRKEQGLKLSSISYHCVFTGNPGTGKTTVARLVAQIYKELGILKKGHLVETDRSGLVAEYIGQTAVKTNKIIDSALDGVLFIDEAYSLVQGGNNDYGMEAISTLLKRMEDDRDRLVVILAGYSAEMKTFIDSNPGLQSRFNRYIHFEDYSVNELIEIYESYLDKYDYKLCPEAKTKLQTVIEKAVSEKDCNFGNARYVRNLFEKTLENQANRLSAETNLTKGVLAEITDIDIPC